MLLEDPADGEVRSVESAPHRPTAHRPMPAEVIRKARLLWPQVRFSTGFGMTELSGNVMMMGPEDHDRAAEQGLEILRSVGSVRCR